MSNLQDLKGKCQALLDKAKSKDVLTALALAALMGSAFYLIRRAQLNKSPVQLHLDRIRSNIYKAIQNNQSLSTLNIEEERTLQKKGISMKFNLISKLKEKEKGTKQAIRNPFLPPFQKGLFVQDMGPNHRLLLNKYNIYEGHLLITTKQFEPQGQPLQKDDIKQTVYACKANRGLYFFNSGPNAGASQKHRHVQIFPREARQLPIFKDMLEFVRSKKSNVEDFKIIQYPPFNFCHGIIVVGSIGMYSESESMQSREERLSKMQGRLSILKEKSYRAYQKLYKQFIGDSNVEYNLVGCEEFLLLVPRSQQKAFGELGVNGVGFMGSVLFKSKQMWERFIKEDRHGYQILQEVTYPKKNKN